MKSIIYTFVSLIIISLIISSCKKNSNPVSTRSNDFSNYFPSTLGTTYKYNFERTDPTGHQTTEIRDINYKSTTEMGGIYALQVDSITTTDSVHVYNSFFRKTDAGVYYYLDTTGFSENLPPEYVPYIPFLKIDQEMLLFSTPLQDGKNWPVFKVNLEQGIVVTVVDVEAKYLGKENITLNLNSGTITKPAAKVEYTFSLINPFTQYTQSVTAYGWFVADIGAVKWEGNALLLNVFTRSEISFSDSTITGSENLIQYNIK